MVSFMAMSNERSDAAESVSGELRFIQPQAAAGNQGTRRVVDYRKRDNQLAPLASGVQVCSIRDARQRTDEPTIDSNGFTLIESSTAVTDWFASEQVTSRYYAECRDAAQRLTGASHTFTFDHLIREPGKQTAGGGLDGSVAVTGADRGGGYVNAAHMDYTDNATWTDYLALHGVDEPRDADRVVVLNFWRPILNPVYSNPLAVCDARTVRAPDVVETEIFGYGHSGYSWHDIGVSVFEVASSDEHEWFYFSEMSTEETLVFKTYDSDGVIGRTCPHGAFTDSSASQEAPPRRSIELRVLCYIGAED